jgi:hypothetical protein
MAMSIYAFGSKWGGIDEVREEFFASNLVGTGFNLPDAPDYYQMIYSMKPGDIVYLKTFAIGAVDITIKGIGIIIDEQIVANTLVTIGRNIRWLNKDVWIIPTPVGKMNSMRTYVCYEEFNPVVQRAIVNRFPPF